MSAPISISANNDNREFGDAKGNNSLQLTIIVRPFLIDIPEPKSMPLSCRPTTVRNPRPTLQSLSFLHGTAVTIPVKISPGTYPWSLFYQNLYECDEKSFPPRIVNSLTLIVANPCTDCQNR